MNKKETMAIIEDMKYNNFQIVVGSEIDIKTNYWFQDGRYGCYHPNWITWFYTNPEKIYNAIKNRPWKVIP